MTQYIVNFAKPLLLTSCIAGAILTLMAPYGTQALSTLPRALYWIGFCICGGLGAAAADILRKKYTPHRTSILQALWQSLGATLVVSLLLIGLSLYLHGRIPPSNYVEIPFKIWVISALICGLARSLDTHLKSDIQSTNPVLLSKLKPALQNADIYALSAEDHYVRVHTSKGDDLIFMRLKDAIEAVAPLPGLPTHRSWWVAEKGIRSVIREKGKLKIMLKNDLSAPVSRSKLKSLSEAGWL